MHTVDAFASTAQFCPEKTKYYMTKDGNEECCDGEVTDSRCIGKRVCTMSSSGAGGIPSCRGMMAAYFTKKGERVCPKEMPNYYETDGGSKAFCTESALTATLEPSNIYAQNCTVYKSPTDNMTRADSCYNQKQLSDMACLTAGCKKMLVPGRGGKMLVMQTYTVADEHIPKTCVTRASAAAVSAGDSAALARTADPKNTEICEVAKRIIVEKRVN